MIRWKTCHQDDKDRWMDILRCKKKFPMNNEYWYVAADERIFKEIVYIAEYGNLKGFVQGAR
jgi:hypothetical protein